MDQATPKAEAMTETINRPALMERNHQVPVPRASYARGNKYYLAGMSSSVIDISGGAGVATLGLSNQIIIEAMKYQLDAVPTTHASALKTPIAESAAEVVMQMLPEMQGGGVTFFSGGAEAVEAACRASVQAFTSEQNYGEAKRAQVQRMQFIGRANGYHGNSLMTLALGDSPRKKHLRFYQGGMEMVQEVVHFRGHSGQGAIDHLDSLLADHEGPATVIIETIGGTAAGIKPYDFEYLKGIRKVCDAHNAILIYDEILCGNFRTGDRMCAFQNLGKDESRSIAPDILVLGKGISGGYFPVSAVVMGPRVRALIDRSGGFSYTTTNQNHPVGCAAVMAALSQFNILSDRRTHLHADIAALVRTVSNITDKVVMRGMGSLWGFQFGPEHPNYAVRMKQELLARGYSCYTSSGFKQGLGNMVLVAPAIYTLRTELVGFGNAFCDALSVIAAT